MGILKNPRGVKKKNVLESWHVALGFVVGFSSFSSSLRTHCDCHLRAKPPWTYPVRLAAVSCR